MITIMMDDRLTKEKRIDFFKVINGDKIAAEYIERIDKFV